MKIGVLLSGCGVFDGAEIQESVLAMLSIKEEGAEYICISVDQEQHHVIDHTKGEEMSEKRNMLVEAARIARGDVRNINDISPSDLDGLLIPGGFGSAKNFTKWAFQGPDGEILPEVKLLLVNMVNVGKPIAALCVSPVVVAKAFQGSSIKPIMTIGTNEDKSEYDINGFAQGLEATGAKAEMKNIDAISYDEAHKIITAPCYMMDTDILGIRQSTKLAVKKLIEVCKTA